MAAKRLIVHYLTLFLSLYVRVMGAFILFVGNGFLGGS
jgi:hypothetical protein